MRVCVHRTSPAKKPVRGRQDRKSRGAVKPKVFKVRCAVFNSSLLGPRFDQALHFYFFFFTSPNRCCLVVSLLLSFLFFLFCLDRAPSCVVRRSVGQRPAIQDHAGEVHGRVASGATHRGRPLPQVRCARAGAERQPLPALLMAQQSRILPLSSSLAFIPPPVLPCMHSTGGCASWTTACSSRCTTARRPGTLASSPLAFTSFTVLLSDSSSPCPFHPLSTGSLASLSLFVLPASPQPLPHHPLIPPLSE